MVLNKSGSRTRPNIRNLSNTITTTILAQFGFVDISQWPQFGEGHAVKVHELIRELQKFQPDTDVEIYAGKCCNVQPLHEVFLHPAGSEALSSAS